MPGRPSSASASTGIVGERGNAGGSGPGTCLGNGIRLVRTAGFLYLERQSEVLRFDELPAAALEQATQLAELAGIGCRKKEAPHPRSRKEKEKGKERAWLGPELGGQAKSWRWD
jgi:hypothetical protein